MKKEIVGHHTKRIFSKDLISTNDSEFARKSGKNFSKNGTFHILPQVLNIPNHMVKLGEQSKRWKKHFVNKVFDYNKDLNLVLLAKWTANGPSINISPVTIWFTWTVETIHKPMKCK